MTEAAPPAGHREAPIVLSVVMPTFNEVDNIVPLIERLSVALAGTPHELVVVDDRSPDGTAAAAREAGRRFPALQVIERDPPPSLTDSIREGVEAARGSHVAWLDCDLSHPPELIGELLYPVAAGEVDMTLASRYAPGARDVRGSSFTRLYGRAINGLCRLLISSAVRDYTSGYIVASRDLILELGLAGDYGEYCIDLLGRAARRGVRIREVPYSMTDRVAGESKTVPSLLGFVRRGSRYLITVARVALGGGGPAGAG